MMSEADYHFTMGEALSLEGKSDRALEEFKLTLVYDPDSLVVRMRLAAEYIRQGMLSEALEQTPDQPPKCSTRTDQSCASKRSR